jgi:demethylmenaquinone methyltransferase/2-methoxy-6-polyprenyl-1,4-benzoquinol methylase
MKPRHPKGYWYLPGILYDLAFKRMFRGLRRRVARTVEGERLFPWLDVCCGTGDQLRGQLRGHVPEVRVPEVGDRPIFGLDLSLGFLRYAAARAPHVPFVCGDAARLPFKDRSLRAVSVSFGLHDKSLELRRAILGEARRVLGPDGRLIAVDFENPWDSASRAGTLFTRAIERLAGRAHYDNGRDFLRRGGLREFLKESGFVEVARRDIPVGSISVVVARVEAGAP